MTENSQVINQYQGNIFTYYGLKVDTINSNQIYIENDVEIIENTLPECNYLYMENKKINVRLHKIKPNCLPLIKSFLIDNYPYVFEENIFKEGLKNIYLTHYTGDINKCKFPKSLECLNISTNVKITEELFINNPNIKQLCINILPNYSINEEITNDIFLNNKVINNIHIMYNDSSFPAKINIHSTETYRVRINYTLIPIKNSANTKLTEIIKILNLKNNEFEVNSLIYKIQDKSYMGVQSRFDIINKLVNTL